ncbi:TRM11 family SAM-dependent methyltransferase [Ilumatobacter nonamiensis]|uniref:TRM11 family SAM-dependent methyltransferase n=1 Tax=Ilumatobacter nonamiensis TaxID=467093 RepID=UPI0003474DD3|nr:RsmD family RNA methyltransferase [Ilumatobacter nonamiensis]
MSEAALFAICARVARHGLITAECESLTGGRPDPDGIATCERIDLVARAAYVQTGLAVLATGRSLDELVTNVGDATFAADGFRIDVHDPSDRIGRSTQEVATALADVIPYGPDLSTPRCRFVVAAAADRLIFGEVVTVTDASYRRHDAKPWTTSSSLDGRFARALVNLVPHARSILDPCCGAGSIVLEAASLGLDAYGVDDKPAMVGMTTENLAHFGYDATVVRADSREHEQRADAIVTDLPYGHAIDADEAQIRGILRRCVESAPTGVFVAPADFSMWIRAAGYDDVEVCTVRKRAGFTRWVHVARRSE